jgi:hypothetical protein
MATTIDRQLQLEDVAVRKAQSRPQPTIIEGEAELPDTGGRFSWRLGAFAGAAAVTFAVLSVVAIHSSGVSRGRQERTQIRTVGDAKLNIEELAGTAKRATPAPAPTMTQPGAVVATKVRPRQE